MTSRYELTSSYQDYFVIFIVLRIFICIYQHQVNLQKQHSKKHTNFLTLFGHKIAGNGENTAIARKSLQSFCFLQYSEKKMSGNLCIFVVQFNYISTLLIVSSVSRIVLHGWII